MPRVTKNTSSRSKTTAENRSQRYDKMKRKHSFDVRLSVMNVAVTAIRVEAVVANLWPIPPPLSGSVADTFEKMRLVTRLATSTTGVLARHQNVDTDAKHDLSRFR